MSDTDDYLSMARDAAKKYGVPQGLFADMLQSKNPTMNPYQVNPDGTGGVASLSPAMAEYMGANTFDPASAFDAAAKIYSDAMKSPQNKTAASIENDYWTKNNPSTPPFNPDESQFSFKKFLDKIVGGGDSTSEPVYTGKEGVLAKTLDKLVGGGTPERRAENQAKADTGEGEIPIDDKAFWQMTSSDWGVYLRNKGITFLFFVLALLLLIFSIKTFIESQK